MIDTLNRQPTHRKSSRGFTLLEVLIALLVLSIGMLGLARLQVASIRFSDDAHHRSLTSMVTSEMMDRIRMATGGLNDQTSRLTKITEYATTTPAGSCNPALSSVANDLACWQASIDDLLPGGSGTITDAGNGSVTVQISWLDRDGQTTRSYSWTFIAGQ